MDVDPNKWFRNAELAALKYIGQETVRYVSNINKYYLIFRFTFETEQVRSSEKKSLINISGGEAGIRTMGTFQYNGNRTCRHGN